MTFDEKVNANIAAIGWEGPPDEIQHFDYTIFACVQRTWLEGFRDNAPKFSEAEEYYALLDNCIDLLKKIETGDNMDDETRHSRLNEYLDNMKTLFWWLWW